MVQHEQLVARLKELRDWSDYIYESLVNDQEWEEGKMALLGTLVPDRELEDARDITLELKARLNGLLDQVQENVMSAR